MKRPNVETSTRLNGQIGRHGASWLWLLACFGMVAVICLAMVGGAGCRRPAPPAQNGPPPTAAPVGIFVPGDPELITANNRGVGLMGRFQYEDARAIFQQLADRHANWWDVQVNLAIAVLNRQREGDEEAALAILERVLQAQPEHLRAQYCSGLLRLYLHSPEEALTHFEKVAERDPQDAHAAYYAGQCRAQLREYEQAIAWYERAMSNDVYLRSAYYAAAQANRALGRDDEAGRMLEQFQMLERNPRAHLADFRYKRMGPKAEAQAVDQRDPQPPMPQPHGPLFADPAPLLTNGNEFTWKIGRDDRPVSITACDIDGDGFIDIFIANVLDDPGLHNAVCINNGDGTFTLNPDHVLAGIPDVTAALWGDFDNDGLTDVYLCRRGPNMLWRQAPGGSPGANWTDVTAATGNDGGAYDTVGGAMFDADHDGDLDIFVVNLDGLNELFNNNLDGTFRPIAQEQGIAGDGRGSIQVLPVDLDGDRDLDIIVINREPPHDVWINDRLWRYRRAEGMDALLNSRINALVAADIDADGRVELHGLRETEGTMQRLRWEPSDAGEWREFIVPYPPDWRSGRGDASDREQVVAIAVADCSGRGTQNVVAATQQFSGVWHIEWGLVHGLRGNAIGSAIAVLSNDRGPSVVSIAGDGSPPHVFHPGPGRYPFATVSFTGRRDGDTMRSNASGIGTHYAARIDSYWVVGSTLPHQSGPGQSLQPQAIGLRGHKQIDFISIDWSDGVFQTEVDLASGEHHLIAETQRQLSSCPVLFAWNGEKYEFISDVLGVGGMGYMVAPGEYAEPRPWENFMLLPGSLASKNGRYVLKLGEPMEEACYLDAVRLVAYDLPPGWKMTLDERMGIGEPAPTGEPRFYRDEILSVQVVNDRGEDVTAEVVAADLRAAPVGEIDRRFIGRLVQDQVLTLRFADPIDEETVGVGGSRSRERRLVIDGWVEYPYSQTMFAAWQAQADYRPPTVEALGDEGEWRVVLDQFGYMAGMPRQMSVPLENLPRGTTQLRITTNQEIYFDRIAIAYAEPIPEGALRHELTLEEARVLRTGFAKVSHGPQRQPYYDYDRRSPYWDTRHQRGYYTAFGVMTELIQDSDDAVAIFGPGEEVHMEFAADLADEQKGWTRIFVLELEGWCKDMDLFTKNGETIEPLPVTPGRDAATVQRREELHQRYNTRFESGR